MVYIIDDWDDNLLTGRPVALTVIDGALFGKGEVLKAKRPEWTTESGSPSVSGGVLHLPAGDVTIQQVSTPSTLWIGTWKLDFNWTTAITSGGHHFRSVVGGTKTYIMPEWRSDDVYRIWQDVDNVAPVSTTHAIDTAEHSLKVTRASGGNWELFFDGVSDGTGTENTYTSCDELWIESNADYEGNWDNLKVY